MTDAADEILSMVADVPVPQDAEHLFGADPLGRLRERNLRRYFDQIGEPRVLLLAEAPGWRGMSVTGVPFLSARQVRAGVLDGIELPDEPAAEWEASSAVVWSVLADWSGPLPLSWPIYPHHPFVAGDPHTNRTPRPSEVRAGTPVALQVARAFGIETILAVGRKAQGALSAEGIEAPAVRHPAQGGARQFAEQVAALNRRA
ncbi:uracil-DNA glycosylase [Leifsonia poae]|uniref:uracil-DNA glycosylase n=1 Tax=Leifsonia poae TaxID=110933 RepID=UPI003D6664FD